MTLAGAVVRKEAGGEDGEEVGDRNLSRLQVDTEFKSIYGSIIHACAPIASFIPKAVIEVVPVQNVRRAPVVLNQPDVF